MSNESLKSGARYQKAVFCSVMQCAAVCCSVLQYVAVCCSELPSYFKRITKIWLTFPKVSVLQCDALCCSVLPCVAVCCNMLQYVAVSCPHMSDEPLTSGKCSQKSVFGTVLPCVAV